MESAVTLQYTQQGCDTHTGVKSCYWNVHSLDCNVLWIVCIV